ncbi:MAG TPA: histidine kinase dimerization/phospho-acceptor domain-containing protein [Candidatus Angelobacter sp.]|nr:histidine kinase dimerization/phospho-acceptor domain-containing protein [Candidatus Angelobacter sp.]
MGNREHTILLVSNSAGTCAEMRRTFASDAPRVRVTSVSNLAGARRVLEADAPAVIVLEPDALLGEAEGPWGLAPSLEAVAASLAVHAPLVVLGELENRQELAGLIAAGAADFVEHHTGFVAEARRVIERRLPTGEPKGRTVAEMYEGEGDFGEVLRHELNNPLTGILGNAELLLAEIHRGNDGKIPHGGEQRLETIASLAVRLRETVRRLSQEWEERQHPVP